MQSAKPASEPRFPLWSLLWRMLLFGPVLMPLGAILLALAFAALLGPYFYGALLLLEERYVLGALVLLAAIVWTPFAWRLLNRLFEGSEYASL